MYIWAPWKLEELKNRRGLFDVEKKLAEKLLKEGLVEDPKIGANKLTKVTDAPAPRKAPKPKKKKLDSDETKAIEPEQTTMIDESDIDVAAD